MIRFSILAVLVLAALGGGGLAASAARSAGPAASPPATAPPGKRTERWPTQTGRRPLAKIAQSGLREFRSGHQNQPAVEPSFGTDGQVSNDNPNRPHNEPAIAANPLSALNFIAGANAYGANSGTGYYATTDGGLTWTGNTFDAAYPGGVGIHGQGDPSVAFDSIGNAYFTDLGTTAADPCVGGVYIHRSTDGGLTWAAPVQVAANDAALAFNDKEWLAADHYPSSPYYDRVYVSWTQFHWEGSGCLAGYTDSPIKMAYSTDNGATFSDPVAVSPTGAGDGENQGSQVVTAADGTVYVAWDNNAGDLNPPEYHVLARSTNGGVTFGPSVRINNGQSITLTGGLDIATFHQYYAANAAGSMCFRHSDFPVISTAPTNAKVLYHAWNDGRWDSPLSLACHGGVAGRHGDIAFNRSTDGGATWSTPVRLNDDSIGNGKDQFFPWLTVGDDGVIHVIWNDRRDDPANVLYHTYYTQSTDSGQTWTPNVRVSDVASDPGKVVFADNDGFIGDYNGIAVSRTAPVHVLPVWTDSRSTQTDEQDIYTDAGVILGTPTPTVTGTPPTATLTRTPTRTLTPTRTPTGTATPGCSIGIASRDVPKTICDRCTITSTINIASGVGTISSVKVTGLDITHTYIGDLTVELRSPGGTTVVLFDRMCNSARYENIPGITLDDAASAAIGSACPLAAGASYQPANPLSTFAGETAPGTWTLSVIDAADQDTGTLNGWGLRIAGNAGGCTGGTPTPTATGNTGTPTRTRPPSTSSPTATRTQGTGGSPTATPSKTPRVTASPTKTPRATYTATPTKTPRPSSTATQGVPTRTPTVTATPTICVMNFRDVPLEHEAYGYIKWGYCQGIINGYSCGTGCQEFRPDSGATRDQIIKMIVLAAGYTVTSGTTPHFSDVPSTDPFYSYVQTAYTHGIINGYDNGTFRPTAFVTRAQLAKMLVGARGYSLDRPASPTFADVPRDYWAYAWIETAARHQLAGGVACGSRVDEPCPGTYFRPIWIATRAQLSQMLFQTFVVPARPGP